MSWLGNSFSSLAGQLNSFTTEVLSEGREESSDHEAEKSLLQQHIKDLKAFLRSQTQEVEHLQKTNSELDDRTKSAEFQVKSLTTDYRTRIQEKEEEIKALRLKNQELKEQVDKLKLPNSDEPNTQSPNIQLKALEDLNDIISCQCEINKLHETVRRLQADRDHWKHLSAHSSLSYSTLTDLEPPSNSEYQEKLYPLADSFKDQSHLVERISAKDEEDYQQLKIDELQNQLHLFQEKTEDQNHVISNLRSQLEKLQSEKSKIDAAFQSMQTENDIVKNTITALHDSEQELQQHLSSARDMLQAQSIHVDENSSVLKDKLIAAEGKISDLLHDREQVSCDLFAMRHRLLAQLHSSHASNAEMLRDLCLVRQKFNNEVTATQSTLDNQKEQIISAIEESNKEHKDIKSRITELMTDQEVTTKESQKIVHELGTPEQQEFIAGAIHALDLENKVIKQTNDDLHKEMLILQENAKSCRLEAMEEFYPVDNDLLPIPITVLNTTALPVGELRLTECNNTDDHKEQVKQLQVLTTVVSSMSEMELSEIANTEEVDQQQEVIGNVSSSCSDLQMNQENAFEENELLVQELEKLKTDIELAQEKLKSATEEHEAKNHSLTQTVFSLNTTKEELEEKLEDSNQKIKTLQAEIKQIKCDQIQSLWKTEPWVDISDGLDTNKENLNMELQDLELDSLSSKCSKEGKSDESSKNESEKKDQSDRSSSELKKNDSFVNIDSSEMKTSDDGSELNSLNKSNSDCSLEKQNLPKDAQTETDLEIALFGNFFSILESILSSVSADMNENLRNFSTLTVSFKSLLENLKEENLISMKVTEDEFKGDQEDEKTAITYPDEFNSFQQHFPQVNNLRTFLETFQHYNNLLKRSLNELRNHSTRYNNVLPKLAKKVRKLSEKDKTIEALERNMNFNEQELRNSRQQIIALNDILRVYKDNLGPENLPDANDQLENIHGTRQKDGKEKFQQQIESLQQEKQQMLLVLNEKSRENASLKAEVHRLMSIVSAEKISIDQNKTADDDIQEMREITVQNLAHIIKTKDEEIEAMKQRNETLVAILQKSSTDDERVHSVLQDYNNLKQQMTNYQAEREQIISALTQKHEESVMYHSEIQRLLSALGSEKHIVGTLGQELEKKDTLLMEKTNELAVVEQKLAQFSVENEAPEPRDFLLNADLIGTQHLSCIAIDQERFQVVCCDKTENSLGKGDSKYLFIPFRDSQLEMFRNQNRIKELENILEELDKGNVTRETFDAKIQTLLKQEDSSFNLFVLADRVQHNANSDRERQLQNEVERLRTHLIEMEELYTQEAIEMEKREKELRIRIMAAEDMNSGSHSNLNMMTEHSLESQNQLHMMREEKSSALIKLDAAENQVQYLKTSLHTLQMVLERFQQEKENEMTKLIKDHEIKLLRERDLASRCQQQVFQLQQQVDDTAEALEAASRISEKLDSKEELIIALKQAVSDRDSTIRAMQEEITKAMTTSDGKIDRSIIKNLIINYFVVQYTQKDQVLHLMGTLLDFNNEERIKVGLEKDTRPWISGWLFSRKKPPSQSQGSNQSLLAAFVQFLEKESRPIPTMKMPAQTMVKDLAHRSEIRSNKANHNFSAVASGSKNDLMAPHLKTITSALPVFTLAPASNNRLVASSGLKDVL